MTISPENIEIRDNYFTELIRSNKSMERFYGASAMNLFIADRYTFIALAWCGTDKQRAYLYWKKAIQASLNVLKRKRFWAILKKMLLSR